MNTFDEKKVRTLERIVLVHQILGEHASLDQVLGILRGASPQEPRHGSSATQVS
ncbi:MAG: hypothetical protein M1272_08115 [Firmicutes bacterium]|nr:hypothetical protein [Bacillota bacterium]